MSEVAIEVEHRDQGTVIRSIGSLAVGDTPILDEKLAAVLDRSPGLVVLDVSRLTFICSAALGTLVDFRKRLAERGGTLRLAGASTDIAGILRKTRLAELFPLFDSAEHAFANAEPQ